MYGPEMASGERDWDPSDEDVLHLKLPNEVQLATVGEVLDKLEPALRGGSDVIPKLLLDMTSTAFASPTGITIVAGGIEHLLLAGRIHQLLIWLPGSPLLAQYLQRMNFFSEMNIDLKVTYEGVSWRRSRTTTRSTSPPEEEFGRCSAKALSTATASPTTAPRSASRSEERHRD